MLNKWITWIAIIFIVYVVAVGKFNARKFLHSVESPQEISSRETKSKTPKEDTLQNRIKQSLPPGEGTLLQRTVNKYAKDYVDPSLEKKLEDAKVKQAPVTTLSHQLMNKQLLEADKPYGDIKKGTGKTIYCGQAVTVHYLAKLFDGTVIEDTRKTNKPVTFTTGKGQVLPGLDIGVVGMQKGGIRKLFVPASMAYDAKGFANDNVPPGTMIQVDATVVDVNDTPFDLGKMQVFAQNKGSGHAPLTCNDVASVVLIVHDTSNNLLLNTTNNDTPLMFQIGQGDVPFGLEQAVLGMKQGGKKTLIIPPELLTSQTGKPLQDMPLFKDMPRNRILLFDVLVTKIYKHYQQ